MGTKDAVAVVGRGVDEEVKSGMEKVGVLRLAVFDS